MEHLDAVASRIGDDDAPVGADGDAARTIEFAGDFPPRPDGERERAVGMEHADMRSVGMTHDSAAVGADGHGVRPLSLNGECERAVGMEHLDAAVAGVGRGARISHGYHARLGMRQGR